jgi:hypothetical protein
VPHTVIIEVQDADNNTTRLNFAVQYDASLAKTPIQFEGERFFPNNINILSRKISTGNLRKDDL